MTTVSTFSPNAIPAAPASNWLKRYYAARALVSIVWVTLAFTLGSAQPAVGAVPLVAYPVWDCLANYVDAACNGGLRANTTQVLNVIVSAIVTIAVVITLRADFHATIAVIGVWAALSGILQLSTGVRRWRTASAQWPQILSGAQSCLAATHFLIRATGPSAVISVADVAPYAASEPFTLRFPRGFSRLSGSQSQTARAATRLARKSYRPD
jgi:uncharacterized membrane protein HdeD (DUF308 family)